MSYCEVEHCGYFIVVYSKLHLDYGVALFRGDTEITSNDTLLNGEDYGYCETHRPGMYREWTPEEWECAISDDAEIIIDSLIGVVDIT